MEWRNMFDMKLGFGGLRLPVTGAGDEVDYKKMCEMVDVYVANGGKYFDTSYIYHGGKSENAMAACVVDRLPRDGYCLADKLPLWRSKGMGTQEDVFQHQLEKCHTDYFDFYLLHNLNSRNIDYVEKEESFDFLRKLKERGEIRFGGFSFHDSPEMLDRLLTEHDEVDFVQLQINYYDWFSNYVNAAKCYEVAQKHDKPVVVMETVRGGGLAALPPEETQLLGMVSPTMSPASFAVRYAAGLDQVMMVLSGMSTLQQVEDNCSCMRADVFTKLSDAEYEALRQVCKMMENRREIPCTDCHACEEICPKDIPVSKIFSIYNDAKIFGQHNFPDMHYAIHTQNHGNASACDGCGKCLERCPAGIDIVKKLAALSRIYQV